MGFTILDAEDGFGGTWWTHRFPGIRSDSDLHTFGYGFKPWVGPPIATAAEILRYMGEVIEENGLGPHLRYRHQVLTAAWSPAEARWTVPAARPAPAGPAPLSAPFLFMFPGHPPPPPPHTP